MFENKHVSWTCLKNKHVQEIHFFFIFFFKISMQPTAFSLFGYLTSNFSPSDRIASPKIKWSFVRTWCVPLFFQLNNILPKKRSFLNILIHRIERKPLLFSFNMANGDRAKRFSHLFCLSEESENEISLKTPIFHTFFRTLPQIMLMKQESCFKSRNNAVRSFWYWVVFPKNFK